MTSTRDRFRPPYARSVQDFPRRCVLVATSNEDSFLSDATGSRRFWPVAVRQLDLNWVTKYRDQLWAEAVHLFRKKEQWWLSDEGEAQRARCSEEFSESDPWEEPIVEWLYERTEGVSIRSLLSEPCGVPTERQSKREQARVASILKRLGWVKRPARERVDGRSISTKLWFPPHDQQ